MQIYKALDGIEDDVLREWEYLLTNGLGGYGSMTLTGRQTRKYHGILVAALSPPVERYMGLAKLSDTISIGNAEFNLNHFDISHKISNESVCPKDFVKHWGASQRYVLSQLQLVKTHWLVKGANRAVVSYEIDNSLSDKGLTLSIRPEFSLRDHHEVTLDSDIKPTWSLESGVLRLSQALDSQVHTPGKKGKRKNELHLGLQVIFSEPHLGGSLVGIKPTEEKSQWVGPYYLDNEAERGLETTLYHFAPLSYTFEVEAGAKVAFHIVVQMSKTAVAPLDLQDIEKDLADTKQYAEGLVAHLSSPESGKERLQTLAKIATLAADDFIVQRKSTGNLSIVAGYPWFTDWGRDSMIALTGLTLSAGQPDRFREIFETFARYMKSGIIPNMFPDDGEAPLYNTVDATLWMPIAMHRYVTLNGADTFATTRFLPLLREIVQNYESGTLNNTYMDEDGLIWSGDESTQLTWMDVKVNGWVVTPRHGKAVEINALWYNSLMIAASLSENETEKAAFLAKGERVKAAFVKAFWNPESGGLYDVVRGEEKLTDIRPNQLFAISLPFGLLSEDQAKAVFAKVDEHLFIGCGLRSLSPTDPQYQGQYLGDVLSRDGAYHRGTGWGWLLGPYLDAYWALSAKDSAALKHIEACLMSAGAVFETLCLGQYPENFDGDQPHHGRGCMAQAWSVAEYLRWVMEVLRLEQVHGAAK